MQHPQSELRRAVSYSAYQMMLFRRHDNGHRRFIQRTLHFVTNVQVGAFFHRHPAIRSLEALRVLVTDLNNGIFRQIFLSRPLNSNDTHVEYVVAEHAAMEYSIHSNVSVKLRVTI